MIIKKMKCDLIILFRNAFLLSAIITGLLSASGKSTDVSLIIDPSLGASVKYAMEKFEGNLKKNGLTFQIVEKIEEAKGGELIFFGTSVSKGAAYQILKNNNLKTPVEPEALIVKKISVSGKSALIFCGADERGLMYAILDASQRIEQLSQNKKVLSRINEIDEQPYILDRALGVYTMNRKYWESRFYDENYWIKYFDMLAANRFNRFHIVFGYENGGFLAPPYPYFFNTPGYQDVRMVNLTPDEQMKNLNALNQLIELAHMRGINVTVGIWDHIYRGGVQTGRAGWLADFKNQQIPNSVVGLSTENLTNYTLASLKELLLKVPKLDGIQFRIHEESGLRRGEMNEFWRNVFKHIHKEKPNMFIELRGKGTPDSVIASAIENGINLRMETKYWMEQMGLPFHPTHINLKNQTDRRHGYADFLRYPQQYKMGWRLWNGGTTRILLWADPDYVKRFSESTFLYDSPNWEIQEPLATKMEAQHPDKEPFNLMPDKYKYYEYEFERYWNFYQVWGRLGYNPNTSEDVWKHEFEKRFGKSASYVESGLRKASKVLPMIVASVYPYKLFPTTLGWAERQTLGDSLSEYANNEGSDIELFENFNDAAKRIVEGKFTAKQTPIETSGWFNRIADSILTDVKKAEKNIGSKRNKEFISTAINLKITAQLARFHAHRALAAVHYNIYLLTQRPEELIAAAEKEKHALSAWRDLVKIAGDHYTFDLAMGSHSDVSNLSGHWRDELPTLEKNLKQLESKCAAFGKVSNTPTDLFRKDNGDKTAPIVEHEKIKFAKPGKEIVINVKVKDESPLKLVRVKYRRVTQFEDYKSIELKPANESSAYSAVIPGNEISPEWDFMYFIEAVDSNGNGVMWPDFRKEPPYVIVKTNLGSN